MLLWFTNLYGKQVAVDNRHITSVYETDNGGQHCTNIVTLNGNIQVKDTILEVVSRLNSGE